MCGRKGAWRLFTKRDLSANDLKLLNSVEKYVVSSGSLLHAELEGCLRRIGFFGFGIPSKGEEMHKKEIQNGLLRPYVQHHIYDFCFSVCR